MHYSKDRLLEIVGLRGTIFVADTRGFHKGKALETGDRLVFQMQFSTDLFGYNYPPVHIGNAKTETFRRMAARFPYTFSNFSD
jgi:hypothetical protein